MKVFRSVGKKTGKNEYERKIQIRNNENLTFKLRIVKENFFNLFFLLFFSFQISLLILFCRESRRSQRGVSQARLPPPAGSSRNDAPVTFKPHSFFSDQTWDWASKIILQPRGSLARITPRSSHFHQQRKNLSLLETDTHISHRARLSRLRLQLFLECNYRSGSPLHK